MLEVSDFRFFSIEGTLEGKLMASLAVDGLLVVS